MIPVICADGYGIYRVANRIPSAVTHTCWPDPARPLPERTDFTYIHSACYTVIRHL